MAKEKEARRPFNLKKEVKLLPIQSGWNSCITFAPFITVSTDGSGSTPSIS